MYNKSKKILEYEFKKNDYKNYILQNMQLEKYIYLPVHDLYFPKPWC